MDEFEESGPSSLDSFVSVLERYGWYILIVSVVAYFIYAKKFKSYIEKYKQHKFEQEYSAKYHKNPDVFAAHVNAQQDWAHKMQEKYNKESERHQVRAKQREEQKRQDLINKYGGEGGHVLGSTSDDKKHNTLKPLDHNPLNGGGSSSNYRPPRRSPCGGGGCGR